MTTTAGNGRIVRTALRDLALVQIRYVAKVRYGRAQGTVKRVYREMEHDFGVLAPPIALHAPAPEVLAASWMMLREAMLAPGLTDRSGKEAVATAVSLGNTCPYCVTMHSSMLRGGDGAALAEDRIGAVSDPEVRAIAAWARAGATRDSAAAHEPPVTLAQAPELVGVAVILQYLNRMVNVFLGEVPLPPGAPNLALGPVTKVLGGLIRTGARRALDPGASLDLLPDAPAPQDLAWAAGSPSITAAFARAAAAIERAARESVPEPVLELVTATLSRWDGEPMPLSRSWVEEAVSGLSAVERPARLALLTALASYQVDRGVVGEYRAGYPQDAALLALTSWSSLAAARRVGGWMRFEPAGFQPGDQPANTASSEN